MDRAYALLHVKALDGERRVFSGLASTPELDRQGHVVDPAGVTFRNPLPLLLHHDQKSPIGRVTLAHGTQGITFEATLPSIDTPGRLKDRVDEAWQSIQAGLITGVSIGFRPLADAIEVLKGGGLKFLQTEIFELSLVTIPANASASILTVKSLAMSGPNPPAVAGAPRRTPTMTTAEQISQFEQMRAGKDARLTALMAKAAEAGTTLDGDETTEYDTVAQEVRDLDAHLTRLRAYEKTLATRATPLPATPATPARASSVITVRPNVPPGTAFVRYTCAVLACKGNKFEAAEYAKRWDDSTPEVALQLKAAVAPGTITDATWAGPLVNQVISSDFLELLRPATILGKIPNLRTVPFNVKVPSQTAGGTYGWVGEAKPKPVTKLAFSAETLTIAKAAGIIVLTEELVRLSNPSAEALVRNDMIAGIARFLDTQFIDPAVAAVAGVNPASITNGAATAVATTNPLADILGLLQHFATNNIPVAGVTIIMSEVNALALAFKRNADGSSAFPNVGINGGSFNGINIVTSQAAGTNVIALQPGMILYADDGGVTIDASREASVQMDSAPMSPADATVVMVSLWQNNLVGVRAERFINYKRVGASVKYLTAAAYPAPAEAAAPPAP
jgi:HK97 family phage major capsid protein/HK97 family phage prohead protease